MIKKTDLLSLLNTLNLPYCILNKTGVFVELNSKYCELYGYSSSELIGNHFTILFDMNCKENIEANNKHFDKELISKRFLNSFGKYKSFFLHPISYKEKDKLGNIFYIQILSLDFKDSNGEEYRLSIDCPVDKNDNVKLIESLIDNELFGFISFENLKKEVDNCIISTYNPKFALINIRLIDTIIDEEIKKEFLALIFSKLKEIFQNNGLIAYKSSKRYIILFREEVKRSKVEECCNQIIDYFSNAIVINNRFLKENIKIGISFYNKNKKLTVDELYKETEIALKFAKLNTIEIYNKKILAQQNQEIKLNTIIFNAYENNEFTAYLQPYFSLKTNKIVGMEALMRLISKEHGIINPCDFIPVLEKNSFIVKVEEELIKRIIIRIKKWKLIYKEIPPVAINLSAIQFKNIRFLEYLRNLLITYDFSGKSLVFEITESILMEDIELSKYMLREFRKMGIRISIDDFGTGYSSLLYLKEFPIDILKIDLSFIRDIHINKSNQAIVSAIILMAKKLGLKTICEGVEKVEELNELKRLDADIVQGYIFSKPLNKKEIKKYFE